MSDNGFLEQVHDANFAMLCELDRVCRENRIRYYLLAGTLLGAVRHKDFIPWDDDVDVVFPRKDYERFLEIFPEKCNERYKLIRFEDNKKFRTFINRVVDTGLMLETADNWESSFDSVYSHPTVDLFIFENAPRHITPVLVFLKFVYGLTLSRRERVDNDQKTALRRMAVRLLAFIGKIFPYSFLCRLYTGTCAFINKKAKGSPYWFISNEQYKPPYWGKLYKKEWFKKTGKHRIRDRYFPGASDADAQLSMIYGDYMKIPDESGRAPLHFKRVVSAKKAQEG